MLWLCGRNGRTDDLCMTKTERGSTHDAARPAEGRCQTGEVCQIGETKLGTAPGQAVSIAGGPNHRDYRLARLGLPQRMHNAVAREAGRPDDSYHSTDSESSVAYR
jgi:hypothetical protein